MQIHGTCPLLTWHWGHVPGSSRLSRSEPGQSLRGHWDGAGTRYFSELALAAGLGRLNGSSALSMSPKRGKSQNHLGSQQNAELGGGDSIMKPPSPSEKSYSVCLNYGLGESKVPPGGRSPASRHFHWLLRKSQVAIFQAELVTFFKFQNVDKNQEKCL